MGNSLACFVGPPSEAIDWNKTKNVSTSDLHTKMCLKKKGGPGNEKPNSP